MNIWSKLMKYLFLLHLKNDMLIPICILMCIQCTINSLKTLLFSNKSCTSIKHPPPKINPRPITLQKCKKNILITQTFLYLFLTHQNHTVGEIRFKSNIQLILRIKSKRVLFICSYLTWVLF